MKSDANAAAIQAVGAVVWVEQQPHQDRWNLGVAFAEMTDEVRVRLRGLLREPVLAYRKTTVGAGKGA